MTADDVTIERLVDLVRAAGGELVGVQVYTVARQPADASVTALERSRLEWIASQAEAVGLDAAVY